MCLRTFRILRQCRLTIGNNLLTENVPGLSTTFTTRCRTILPRVRHPLGFAGDLVATSFFFGFVVGVAKFSIDGFQGASTCARHIPELPTLKNKGHVCSSREVRGVLTRNVEGKNERHVQYIYRFLEKVIVTYLHRK